jgi:hypothetical protein
LAARPARRAVAARQRALPDDDHRLLGALSLTNLLLAVGQSCQRFRTGAEIFVIVAQIAHVRRSRRSAVRSARHALRMRALRTGLRWRGLEPTIRIASASSMPSMVELKM